MDSSDIVLKNLIPALGGTIGVAMFATPLKGVLEVRRNKKLGSFNPLPLMMITINCMSWIGYSYAVPDAYIFVPNAVGFLLGVFYVMTVIGFSSQKMQDLLMGIVLVSGTLFTAYGALDALLVQGGDTMTKIWGYTSVAVLFLYYGAPMSTILTVIRTRNSASICLPLVAASLINGSLWTTYGLVQGDYFVWVPNGVGVLLSASMLCVRLLVPRVVPTDTSSQDSSTQADTEAALALAALQHQQQQHDDDDQRSPAASLAPLATPVVLSAKGSAAGEHKPLAYRTRDDSRNARDL